MNRSDLSWALSAVIPHAGSKGSVGIQLRGSQIKLYATDGYTLGVASVPNHSLAYKPLSVLMDVSEAKELERWIRPARVPEREQLVEYAVNGDDPCEIHKGNLTGSSTCRDCESADLHIGYNLGDSTVMTLEKTAVFEARLGSELDRITSLIRAAESRPAEWDVVAVNPGYLSRFTKAARSDQPLTIEFKRADERSGVLIFRATSFIGLAMNLSYERARGLAA